MTSPLSDARVVLGVCGGIAAYKSAELCRLLDKAGAQVSVMMTASACRFIAPLTFHALTGRPVLTDLYAMAGDHGDGHGIDHIRVADSADVVVLAPATATTIARLAAGLADDAVAAVCLATRAKMVLAPAMNVNMWQHPITQRNVATIAAREGVTVCGPGAGFLACRWTGPGRMAEPADIVEATARALTVQDLANRTVVVTAGPTREAIDPMRFLSNRSTGKMGVAIARSALRRGARVILVAGPMATELLPAAEVIRAHSAREMEAAVRDAASAADVVIMAAAVADFRAAEIAPQKLAKGDVIRGGATLALAANPDILAGLGKARAETGGRRPILVGFAAETVGGDALIARARQKLTTKQVDLICANDVSAKDAGFASEHNRVVLVGPTTAEALPLLTKDDVAAAILDRVVDLISAVDG